MEGGKGSKMADSVRIWLFALTHSAIKDRSFPTICVRLAIGPLMDLIRSKIAPKNWQDIISTNRQSHLTGRRSGWSYLGPIKSSRSSATKSTKEKRFISWVRVSKLLLMKKTFILTLHSSNKFSSKSNEQCIFTQLIGGFSNKSIHQEAKKLSYLNLCLLAYTFRFNVLPPVSLLNFWNI